MQAKTIKGKLSAAARMAGKVVIPLTLPDTTEKIDEIFQGTFTTPAESGRYFLNIPYKGTGYVISALFIAEEDPVSNNDYYHGTRERAVGIFAMNKTYKNLDPSYDGSWHDNHAATVAVFRRAGATEPDDYEFAVETGTRSYYISGASPYFPNLTFVNIDPVAFSYYVCNEQDEEQYGLDPNTTYRYMIAYSSEEDHE